MINKFYPIVDNIDWIKRFLPLGVKTIQLRLKDMSEPVLRDQISRAKALCKEYACQFIVNDHWKIALDEGCDYVHLGQGDLIDADVVAIKKNNVKMGISTHDRSELQYAIDMHPDYIALGPVFHTTLKKMKWEPQGIERVKTWKTLVGDIPLVAIGGMTPSRAVEAFAKGADSVAVVTDVIFHKNPEERVKEWLALTAEDEMK